ncbi:hypothetical protein SAMN05660199_00328 [Klenkia soli]|uniref:Uncharacterized protein n=1 Tax=Klenkia soli TaxID=1052260 RepID=A0A1H0CJY1_9ACTN|nr:hypothetical protein [Klenkia soli]SDN58071.1 hypothetical protein SAMN05660199_00328 [Klenkia soli]
MSALGSALRLLPRLDRRTCDLDDLVDAARLLVAGGRPGLRLVLDEDDPHHPWLEVEEDERSLRTDLADLADEVVGSQLDLGPAGLAAALDRWVDERPVTDAEAARRGIAVLAWTGTSGGDLAWQVAVQRRTGLVGWAPHPFSAAADVLGIREAARARAADVVVRCTVEGPVLLLDADQPHLATAALSAPEQILARMAALGLRLSEGSVVVTPGRPVAWAGRAVAERLAGETVEPCAVLSWRDVLDLPWA